MRSSKELPIGAAMPMLRIMHETPKFQTSSGKIIKEFTGHITFWHHARQFYARPADQCNQPGR